MATLNQRQHQGIGLCRARAALTTTGEKARMHAEVVVVAFLASRVLGSGVKRHFYRYYVSEELL